MLFLIIPSPLSSDLPSFFKPLVSLTLPYSLFISSFPLSHIFHLQTSALPSLSLVLPFPFPSITATSLPLLYISTSFILYFARLSTLPFPYPLLTFPSFLSILYRHSYLVRLTYSQIFFLSPSFRTHPNLLIINVPSTRLSYAFALRSFPPLHLNPSLLPISLEPYKNSFSFPLPCPLSLSFPFDFFVLP